MRRSTQYLLASLIIAATSSVVVAQGAGTTPVQPAVGNTPKAADPTSPSVNAATPQSLEDSAPPASPPANAGTAATTAPPATAPATATTTTTSSQTTAPSQNTPAAAAPPAANPTAATNVTPATPTAPLTTTSAPAQASTAPQPTPATPATTETTASPPSAAPAVAAPVAPPAAPPVDPIATALGELLDRSTPPARQATEREWHKGVLSFYAARANNPLWVGKNGFTDQAGALIAEVSRADDWGLNAKAFALPAIPTAGAEPATLAEAELKLTRAVLTYAWHARGGRLDPVQLSKWLDQSPRPLDAKALLDTFAASSEPARTLTGLHPKHPQFELLRKAYLTARDGDGKQPEDPTAVTIPKGPRVKIGDRHPHVTLVRKRLSLPLGGDNEQLYDEELAEAVGTFLGWKPQRSKKTGKTLPARPSLDDKVRASLSRKAKEAAANRITLKKYLVNLERWRWMPETLGTLHVWNNLPEYTTRVMRNNEVLHQERIIIGKPDTQTPIFSDTMRFVVFHPDWGVPNTIKVKDLLPSLQSGDDSILHRRNMRIVGGGRSSDPGSIDWESTDIRRVAIVQEPGPDNPLGQLKFMFPNKHDVYMHDTPTKHLFNSATRAYSFGCIRVRNPKRLAELVFGVDRGWNQTQIADLTAPRAQPNNRIDLNRSIPVHNTYFTLTADADGKVQSFADVYGHDKRVQAVLLDGQSIERVAQSDPALALERKVKDLAEAPPRPRRDRDDEGWGGGYWGWGQPPPRNGRYRQQPPPFSDFFSGIFGN